MTHNHFQGFYTYLYQLCISYKQRQSIVESFELYVTVNLSFMTYYTSYSHAY